MSDTAARKSDFYSWKVWKTVLLSGLVGFLVIVTISWIALLVSPIWTAIIWSFPLSSVVIIFTYWLNSRPATTCSALLFGTSMTVTSMILFFVIWAVGIAYVFNDREYNTRIWGSFGLAVAVWLSMSAVIMSMYFSVPAFRKLIEAKDNAANGDQRAKFKKLQQAQKSL